MTQKKTNIIRYSVITIGSIIAILFMSISISYVLIYSKPPTVVTESTPKEIHIDYKPIEKKLYFIDNIIESMVQSNIVFNVPDSHVDVGQSFTIKLLLHLSMPIENLEKELRETVEGKVEGYQIKISDIVEARLTGYGFQISSVTPEEQPISIKHATEWKWNVKALEPGIQHLHLTINAIIDLKGETKKRAIRTFDREIKVNVTLGKEILSFLKNNWQWFCTALLIPLITFIWKNKKKDKDKALKEKNGG